MLQAASASLGCCKASSTGLRDLNNRARSRRNSTSGKNKGEGMNSNSIVPQRVQLECHYGIRSPKPYHIWFSELEFHNGTLIGPSGCLLF